MLGQDSPCGKFKHAGASRGNANRSPEIVPGEMNADSMDEVTYLSGAPNRFFKLSE
jgi:hypothetical protein